MNQKRKKIEKRKHPRKRLVLKGPQRLGGAAGLRRRQAARLCCRFPVCESQPFKGEAAESRVWETGGRAGNKGSLSAGLRPGFVNAAFTSSQKDERLPSLPPGHCAGEGEAHTLDFPIPLPSLLPSGVCLRSQQGLVSLLVCCRSQSVGLPGWPRTKSLDFSEP